MAVQGSISQQEINLPLILSPNPVETRGSYCSCKNLLTNSFAPVRVRNLENKKIVQISCGQQHSIALDDNGCVIIPDCMLVLVSTSCGLVSSTYGGPEAIAVQASGIPKINYCPSQCQKYASSILLWMATRSNSASVCERCSRDEGRVCTRRRYVLCGNRSTRDVLACW